MSKKDEYVHIKANGVRNELKDIRKALNKLTNVMEDILMQMHIQSVKHTHEHEKATNHRKPLGWNSHGMDDEHERHGESKITNGGRM